MRVTTTNLSPVFGDYNSLAEFIIGAMVETETRPFKGRQDKSDGYSTGAINFAVDPEDGKGITYRVNVCVNAVATKAAKQSGSKTTTGGFHLGPQDVANIDAAAQELLSADAKANAVQVTTLMTLKVKGTSKDGLSVDEAKQLFKLLP